LAYYQTFTLLSIQHEVISITELYCSLCCKSKQTTTVHIAVTCNEILIIVTLSLRLVFGINKCLHEIIQQAILKFFQTSRILNKRHLKRKKIRMTVRHINTNKYIKKQKSYAKKPKKGIDNQTVYLSIHLHTYLSPYMYFNIYCHLKECDYRRGLYW
jgi:hypothetical protein